MKQQAQHMIDVLRATLRALGFTNREIESRLGVSRGYLTRLFSGQMELRFDHITEIAEAVGVDPDELFRLAFPPSRKPASNDVMRLREKLGATPEPGSSPSSMEDLGLQRELERLVSKTVREVLSKTTLAPVWETARRAAEEGGA
jgi:transcriptional regulator with XRE-family HTH domain